MYDTFQKTLIAWAFNHYIAYYYFDNVNVTQLKVAFEKGEIELENLLIKRDALGHLKLPWDVVSGTVGKLSIKIPLFSILTNPWIIKMSNLTLIVATRSQTTRLRSDSTTGDECGTTNVHQNEEFRRDSPAGTEESKLVEFYSSFSATLSSIVKDICKNIKLEIDHMTLLFEGVKNGVVKFSADYLLFHRPENMVNTSVIMVNTSIFLSTWTKQEHLFKINLASCNLRLLTLDIEQLTLDIDSETNIIGTVHIVGSNTPAIPICKLLIEDFRMLFFSANQHQDGSIFARVSCRHFNRDAYTWDDLLEPWPFNLSWNERKNERRYSLTSDELAEITLSSTLLDLLNAVYKILRRQDPAENYRLLYRSTNRHHSTSPRACKLSHYNILLAGSLSRWPRSRIRNYVRRDKSEINFVGPGFRFTLVDSKHEKILRVSFEKVVIKTTIGAENQVLDCSIQDICIESALPGCIKTIVLDRASSTDNSPALRLIMDRILGKSFGTLWFRQVQLSICELAINVEERLVLKLVEFFSIRFRSRTESNTARDLSRNLFRVSKYYFDMLRIDLEGLRVSFFKSQNLSETLQNLKIRLDLTFYNFEDARVHLSPYLRMNVSQTWLGVIDSIGRFYKKQVSEQAPWILIQQLYCQIRNYLPNAIPYLYEEVYSNLFY